MKILCRGVALVTIFFLGSLRDPLASSVLGGGVSSWGLGRGTFMLPLGFFWPFIRAPLICGFFEGGVGAWMASIWDIKVFRLGAACKLIYVVGCLGLIFISFTCLVRSSGPGFLTGFFASAFGLYSSGISRGGPRMMRGSGDVGLR